jgi:hypothetical protein
VSNRLRTLRPGSTGRHQLLLHTLLPTTQASAQAAGKLATSNAIRALQQALAVHFPNTRVCIRRQAQILPSGPLQAVRQLAAPALAVHS